MSRVGSEFDDEDEDRQERDDPADGDVDDRDDAEPIPCPYCGKPVYEQAEICPHCNSFISFEDAVRRRPWWIWAGVILALVALLSWVF